MQWLEKQQHDAQVYAIVQTHQVFQCTLDHVHEYLNRIHWLTLISVRMNETNFWTMCYSRALTFDAVVKRIHLIAVWPPHFRVLTGANEIAYRIEKAARTQQAVIRESRLCFSWHDHQHPRSCIHQLIGTFNLDAHNVESVGSVCRTHSTRTARAVDASIWTFISVYSSKSKAKLRYQRFGRPSWTCFMKHCVSRKTTQYPMSYTTLWYSSLQMCFSLFETHSLLLLV